MKKFLALILAVLMIAGSVVSVAAFDDVSGKYADAINGLQGTGIVAGKSETEFGPDELVTRWQMALFMARSVSAITDDAEWAEGAKIFTDCTQYLGAIQYCFGKGIIKGVTATEFAPDANILFRDGIIMALRALGYEKEDEGREESAKKYNKTGAQYWAPYYDRAIELGLLENLGNIAVDKALTRAETAQLIYNMIYTPVYDKAGNENAYTLYDVAFGGKNIVKIDNSKEAWIVETPGYFFGSTSYLDEDAEEVIIAWNEVDDGGRDTDPVYFIETAEVDFDDLAKWGVDVENIDEYFGASLEIINYKEDYDDDDNVDYSDYEYLMNFKKAEPVVLTHEDIKLSFVDDDSKNAVKYAKIGTKTHYEDAKKESEKKNTIVLYTQDIASDKLDDVKYKKIDFKAIQDRFYDIKLYDVDGDSYYEYGIVNFYKMDRYEAADAKGREKFGAMKGLTEVVYSQDLAKNETFVYTFDLATKKVDVKSIVEENVGKITAYSEKEDDNGDVIGYITIGDTKYTIIPDVVKAIDKSNRVTIDIDESEALRKQAAEQVGDTYEFYALDDKLLSFDDKIEDEDNRYLIVKDFTDFELYDHVAMDVIVDAAEANIKVNKIRELKEDGTLKKIHKLDEYSYSKLAKQLENVFGVYKYTVDADGFYTLTRADFKYDVADFVTSATAINFKDGVVTNYKSTAELKTIYGASAEIEDRNAMLRINSATQIYLVDMTDEEVEAVTAKAKGEFSIILKGATKFYADKIGYGTNDKDLKDPAITWDHGVASVIYIYADEVDFGIDPADYSLIFVREDVEAKEVSTEREFGLSDDDKDEESNPAYTKYEFDEEAFILSTFAAADVAFLKYDKKSGRDINDPLTAGVYLLDKENRIINYTLLENINKDNLNVLEVPDEGEYFGYVMADLTWDNFDLYNWEDIRIDTTYKVSGFDNGLKGYTANGMDVIPFKSNADSKKNCLTSNIQTIEFMEITKEFNEKKEKYVYDAEYYTAKKDETKPSLREYIEEEQKDDNTITVIIAGNCPVGKTNNEGKIAFMSAYSAVAGNTLKGVIVDNILAAEDEGDTTTDDSTTADDTTADDTTADDTTADDTTADDTTADDTTTDDTTTEEETSAVVTLNDADGNPINTIEVEPGKKTVLPAAAVVADKNFAGWSTTGDAEGIVSRNYKVEADATLSPVYLDGALTIAAEEVTVSKTAETVDVTINVSNNPGVTSLGFEVVFDADALKYKSVTYGNVFAEGDFTLDENFLDDGSLFVSVFSIENKRNNDAFITITFELADGVAAGDFDIQINEDPMSGIVNEYEMDVDFELVSGKVTITD